MVKVKIIGKRISDHFYAFGMRALKLEVIEGGTITFEKKTDENRKKKGTKPSYKKVVYKIGDKFEAVVYPNHKYKLESIHELDDILNWNIVYLEQKERRQQKIQTKG